ncbi:dihydroorotate dehydrogenase (quinone), mitochondrial isoform X2 [Halyomorpha halys]|uniref:dihydroorotate dehydrogenase (quinone), mitochondrial isoform X2 n=1 Tax=Halyomorpha halys TaxID=286706 RepID=UPI0006D4E720|nr:dihydroorotate dehydrogenase (quinone), mitochondrial isoform X2 [Halyomorpha halys]
MALFLDRNMWTNQYSKLWNLEFSNPIGMAAGFDKDAEAVDGLLKIGFGFVEVGSVTPLPQAGNDRPRVFRLPSNKAIINRYGFNSEGHDAVLSRVKSARKEYGVVGVNLGKNKESTDPVGDYAKGIVLFSPYADYLVINISSPNTPGLRDWQRKEQLEELLTKLKKVRDEQSVRPPLLLKLAPDLTTEQVQDIAGLVSKPQCKVDGLVISNTSTSRYDDLEKDLAKEAGGLSGAPIAKTSTSMIATMHKLTKGQIPIIGVGGVFTGKDALEKIKAGASLVQLYTAFVYHGPPRITRLKKELTQLLENEGFKNISEAVGVENKAFLSEVNEKLNAKADPH